MLYNYLQGLNFISNMSVLTNILDTVEHFCKVDTENGYTGTNSLLYRLENAGALDLLEELQKVPNDTIYNRVIHLFESYIGVEENETMTV